MPKFAEILARFSHDFGGPFLRGEKCHVGSPLGRDGRLAVRNGLGVDQELELACEAQLEHAAHMFDVTPAPFDEDAGTLLYAVHELFACTHPQASSFYARAHLFCRAAAQAVHELPRTFEPRRLLTRHLIVERAFATTRTDIHVKWWTGQASFYGEDAPKRLTAWPGLRRVRQDRLTQPMWRLAMGAGDEDLRIARTALLVALLDVSPLTRMLAIGDDAQKALGFSLLLPWTLANKKASPLDVLEDRRLARAVVDTMMRKGMSITGSSLAVALLQCLREGCPPSILRRAAELCVHLVLTACMVEADAPGAEESAPLRALLDDDVAALDDKKLPFWTLVGASFALDGALLSIPSTLELPDRASAIFNRVQKRLAHPRVRVRSEPLEREIIRRLPKGAEAA